MSEKLIDVREFFREIAKSEKVKIALSDLYWLLIIDNDNHLTFHHDDECNLVKVEIEAKGWDKICDLIYDPEEDNY